MLNKKNYIGLLPILLSSLTLFQEAVGNFVRRHDYAVCKQSRSNTSCNHQLEPEVKTLVECDVEYISQRDCSYDGVDQIFEPRNLPFNLQLYEFRDTLFHTVANNISFPHPNWKTMSIYLKNQHEPRYRICRKFHLYREVPVNISSTLFWDCLLFSVESIEDNFYDLYIKDDKNFGGIYSFRIPSARNFDVETTNITGWHVFFFIHQHYLDRTDNLVVTLQPAPFSNISYDVSLVRCLNQSLRCDERIVLRSISVDQGKYTEEDIVSLTVQLKTVPMPGNYAATVQIVSPLCNEGRCATSLSPPFEWRRTYTVEIVLGLLGVIMLICLSTFLLMKKIHVGFYNYVERKSKNLDSVLFVYHADSEEMFLLFKYLSGAFLEKFYIQPLLVDEEVAMTDPNDWTRCQLCHATKVLFFVPRNPRLDSVTPIQRQWNCAITYLSGSYLKENQNISSRCASVLLPNSSPPIEGDEIYSLKRFYLEKDLPSIANWLHRNSFLDRFLWRSIAKELSRDLSAVIKFAVDSVAHPVVESCLQSNKKQFIISADTNKDDEEDSLPSDDSSCKSHEENDEKIRNEFDPLIPDVSCVRFQDDSSDDYDDQSDDEEERSDDEHSANDVMNFAT